MNAAYAVYEQTPAGLTFHMGPWPWADFTLQKAREHTARYGRPFVAVDEQTMTVLPDEGREAA